MIVRRLPLYSARCRQSWCAPLRPKDNAKAAWDTLKMLRVGDERVREAKAQTRR
jgi:hypothetical protein